MIQGKLVRALGYYNDASYIERVVATFRKLLIDVDWIYGRRLNDEGLYEVYLLVREHSNLQLAILNLSKTVGIERVDVFDDLRIEVFELSNRNNNKDSENTSGQSTFVLYIPIYSRAVSYSWGERYGKDI